jgi:hypothetical protein
VLKGRGAGPPAHQHEAQRAAATDDVPQGVEGLDLHGHSPTVDAHLELLPAAFCSALLGTVETLAFDARPADTTIGRRRCVQRGIHSAATDQLDAFGKLADDGAIDVSEHDPIVAEVKVGLGPGGQQRVAMHTG